ncbi:MAG: hypothetical protein KDK39_07725 [Leptospiraceae bacterium]|nr:hypothetical protein [Leptospiraceae bacterium]
MSSPAEADRVYRFFATQGELMTLLQSRWSGQGIHALPWCDIHAGVALECRYHPKGKSLRLGLKSKKPGRVFFQGRPSHGAATGHALETQLELPLEGLLLSIDADYALLTNQPRGRVKLKITFQAIQERRLHCQIELSGTELQMPADGIQFVSPSDMWLAFSGVMKKL